MNFYVLSVVSTLILSVTSFSGSEDKFLKKYAMMKIYESCFGPEVIKLIRKEMKMACAKCAAFENPPPTPPPKPAEDEPAAQQPTFDADKLHQAILAYRPTNPLLRPYPSPFYNQQFANAAYQGPLFYPNFPQQAQFSPYGFPLIAPAFYNNRVSRDMDIKTQLEALTSRLSGRVRNITCVMQELGYLDSNLEPNYQKITERISNLPVGEELRRDMQDGVNFCQQFSQCVPEVKRERSPLSRELIRPMFFFKCYKHKKLEACIMKDVREKYAGVSDDEFDSEIELRRQGKSMDSPKTDGEIEELAASLFEFLYGSENNIEIDTLI